MYKLTTPDFDGEIRCVRRITDNAFIPFDPANTDYAEYLKWLDAGNTPQPTDSIANEQSKE